MLIPMVFVCIGGKVKPLKAPKKETKELDEDEVAFKEKQKAGMFDCAVVVRFLCGQSLTGLGYHRCESEEGIYGKGQGQGTSEYWKPGYQEVREEINVDTHDWSFCQESRYYELRTSMD